jgi:uncharacterized protein YndB with AHSA1/START domain
MPTRKHTHQIELSATPGRVFAALITPSAIRAWWGAARAVVIAQEDGTWAAAWGEREDDPDYVTAFRIGTFDPPRRLVLTDTRYFARSGPLPFTADFVTEFTVEPRPGGCILRVVQDGFPADSGADAFYAACETGWHKTFEGIRRYLAEDSAKGKTAAEGGTQGHPRC